MAETSNGVIKKSGEQFSSAYEVVQCKIQMKHFEKMWQNGEKRGLREEIIYLQKYTDWL